jgi:sarcosine oxidase subunit alpha
MATAPRVRFRFRGRDRAAPVGDPLLRSLVAAERRLPVLQRSIRYHRPRAPFCGIGVCTQCLVRVNGVPNVRSCRYAPREGDRVETENAWPSPRVDLLGVLDFVFYRGLDTLRGFRRPRFAMPLYQRVVRRLAGYGRLPDFPIETAATSGREAEVDTLVIGGGPSGRAAAARLADAGEAVGIVDRGPLLAPPAAVEPFSFATVVFLPPPDPARPRPFYAAAIREEGGGLALRARRVVLAPGAYDAALFFAGSDRPGVLTAEGALALRSPGAPWPFERAVLVGAGDRAAEMLDRAGPQVAAVVAPGPIAGEVARRAAELGIPLYPRTLLVEARGPDRVRSVLLRPRGAGRPFRLRADAVLLAHRRLPHLQLFFQVGAPMHWRGGAGSYFPRLDEALGTGVPGLFAAGEAAGVPAPVAAEASGIAAAEAALGRRARLADLPPRVPEPGPHELEGYYRELLDGDRGRGKWIACPCEDVLLDEVEAASHRGYRGIEVVKRYTSLGTGLCQGRYCLPDTLLWLARLEGRAPADVGFITQRPPVVPSRLATWASLPVDERSPAQPPASPGARA